MLADDQERCDYETFTHIHIRTCKHMALIELADLCNPHACHPIVILFSQF